MDTHKDDNLSSEQIVDGNVAHNLAEVAAKVPSLEAKEKKFDKGNA